MRKRKPIYGVGINDADYVTQKNVNGKNVICHFYQTWKGMLERCYSAKCQEKQPTYKGCSVCEEWLTFSNFKEWMDSQYWYIMELDKDVLVKGNKAYSPETCIFVSSQLNLFTTDREKERGDYPIGVNFHKKKEDIEQHAITHSQESMSL